MDQVFGFGQELGETRTEFWRPQVFNRAFRRHLTCAVGRAPLSEVAPIPAILLFLLDSPGELSNLCYLYNKKLVGLKILGENHWKPQDPKVLNCIKLPVFVAIPPLVLQLLDGDVALALGSSTVPKKRRIDFRFSIVVEQFGDAWSADSIDDLCYDQCWENLKTGNDLVFFQTSHWERVPISSFEPVGYVSSCA